MAQIRKITRRDQVSTFQNVAVDTGSSLRTAAGLAMMAYENIKPAAIEQMKEQGTEAGVEMARSQIGNPNVTMSSKGSDFRNALRGSESGGNYGVINSEGYTGAYQWGQGRLDDYNKANGTNWTLEQFRSNPSLQETAQDWHEGDILKQLGGFVGTTVNGQVLDEAAIIGMAHLGGVGGARQYIETGGAYNPADSNGTRLSDYASRFGGLNVRMSSQSEPTVVMTSDGKIEPRLYSPLSGEILQAHNAAAQIAYRSEIEVKAAGDLLDLSNQFLLNPGGFQQAAQQYIDQLVQDAPAPFRPELRLVMDRTVGQRYLGMVEDQQRDTRQRAANANYALVDRYSNQLAEAIASGNTAEIETARTSLDSALTARQALPGLAWTPEQSTNVILDAEKTADRLIKSRQAEVNRVNTDKLKSIIAAAENGQVAADEGILKDPTLAAALPDLTADALAAVTFRDALPSFQSAPPAERKAVIDELRAQPVTDPRDVKMVKAAEKADETVTKAFKEDPVAAAGTYLSEKPPEIISPTEDPQGFATTLKARFDYMASLKQAGYPTQGVILSAEEAKTLGPMFGRDIPPEMRAAAAGAVVSSLGADAQAFFRQIKTDSQVLPFAGMMMALGNNPEVATEMLRGEAMLEQKMEPTPTGASSLAAVSPDIAAAVMANPGAQAQIPQIMAATRAIFVARNPGYQGDDRQALMEDALQAALGRGTDIAGNVTGGVAEIGGRQTLVPVGVRPEDMQGAIEKALAPPNSLDVFGDWSPDPAVWKAAGALGRPMIGDRAVQLSRDWNNDLVQLVPVQGDMYRLQIKVGDSWADAYPEGSPMLPFLFRVGPLMEATQK